ncbi:GntR family transcriptional regulator [Hankyongella ginsenosidimutans]|uniref:GntR family transcriptional regulator n=1 Tax=Hankyongella ginsenosidimutans TaxID=1763828 RepID=A0A4D7C892_9SPHN|nr:GntR family transcriptional regulator [Hankyongella ginsenosidimutans]
MSKTDAGRYELGRDLRARVRHDQGARALGRGAAWRKLEPAGLAAELNSSVTPVRDALHRLAGERLVESWTSEGFHLPHVKVRLARPLHLERAAGAAHHPLVAAGNRNAERGSPPRRSRPRHARLLRSFRPTHHEHRICGAGGRRERPPVGRPRGRTPRLAGPGGRTARARARFRSWRDRGARQASRRLSPPPRPARARDRPRALSRVTTTFGNVSVFG